jgi:hypothetical protein
MESPRVFHIQKFRAPRKSENWKSEILPRDDLLEIGPEWRR